jgi:nicotinate-nucleotide adenylyltransferase
LKIAILGGTFDPPHYGHLRTALEIKEIFNADEVWFIPSAYPPHKDNKQITPYFYRKKMLELALKDFDFFVLQDIESSLPRPSYTINTIKELKKLYPDNTYYLIIGSDAFKEIEKWKSGNEIIDNCNLVIVVRDLIDEELVLKNKETVFKDTPLIKIDPFYFTSLSQDISEQNVIYYVSVTHLEISSEKIRKLSRENHLPTYLTPENVIEYINKFRLYDQQRYNNNAVRPESSILLNDIAQIILENKGKNVITIDLTENYSDFADYFVICDANSTKQINGICDKIDEELSQNKIYARGIEGKEEGTWMLMDYGDIIVHIFNRDTRANYDLEGLWNKAKITAFSDEKFSVEEDFDED